MFELELELDQVTKQYRQAIELAAEKDERLAGKDTEASEIKRAYRAKIEDLEGQLEIKERVITEMHGQLQAH